MNNINKVLFRLRTASLHLHSTSVRQLFTPASLGIEEYVANRTRYVTLAKTHGEKFRKQMLEYVDSDSPTTMIFTDDLKQIVHIAEPNEEDMVLIEKLFIKFQSQQTSMRFGSYIFGTVLMRMYHHLNKPEEALKIYKEEKLERLFDQLTTHIILMDLLFHNGMYDEVIEVYSILRNKQLHFGRHPKNVMMLVFASYYKINTIEAYNAASELWKEMHDSGHQALRRVACYLAALALNQNTPHAGLEIVSSLKHQHYILTRCIKILALCAVSRTEDAIPILKNILEMDRPDTVKHTFPADVIQKVQESVQKANQKELTYEFNRVMKQLGEQGHITNTTLDSLMCSDIALAVPMNKTQNILNASFEDREKESLRQYRLFRRPGLADMV